MVELPEGIILSKGAPKEAISFSYEKGSLNVIPYNEKYKFAFLMLKNQSLDSGTFIVDGVTIFPNEEGEDSLFFLTVNSLIRIHLCFVVAPSEKKEKVKHVQSELMTLIEMPLETEEDKNNKIVAILNKVDELSPNYILVDFNDPSNSKYEFILNELNNHVFSLNIIALDKEGDGKNQNEQKEDFKEMDLLLGSTAEEPIEEVKTKKAVDNKSFWKTLSLMAKENVTAFLSFIVPSLGVISFSLLSPLYAQTNKVLLIPFIITIVLCFSLFMIMTYRCAEFKSRNEMFAYAILNAASVLTGYGLSIAIYFIFLNFDKEIAELKSANKTGIIISVVLTLLLLSAFFYVPLLVNTFKKLTKKK